MTLLELLRQELPKRGGWPEGVYTVEQDSEGRLFEMDSDYCSDFKLNKCDDWLADVVTKQQYESALAASQKQVWNGEGLPPVGCECEWQDKNTGQWQPVKIVYASEWVTVIREINEEKGDDLVEIAIENYGDDARLKFRPLRTEAERAIDEMVQLSGVSIGAAKILYDAGYRKG